MSAASARIGRSIAHRAARVHLPEKADMHRKKRQLVPGATPHAVLSAIRGKYEWPGPEDRESYVHSLIAGSGTLKARVDAQGWQQGGPSIEFREHGATDVVCVSP
jgi:hypothetical protein